MSLTISIEPELEAWLRQEAQRRGETPEEMLAQDLTRRWASSRNAPRLSMRETELLKVINVGLPDTFWNRYRELIARRRAENLTEAEQQELVALSDQTEKQTLQQTEAILTLANLRGVSFDEIRHSLGIHPISLTL